uniref:Uncharacterized protein n=1 Tax=Arundo donax TaxID=35708 RepID=A0A0A9C3M0_ARUDO
MRGFSATGAHRRMVGGEWRRGQGSALSRARSSVRIGARFGPTASRSRGETRHGTTRRRG